MVTLNNYKGFFYLNILGGARMGAVNVVWDVSDDVERGEEGEAE